MADNTVLANNSGGDTIRDVDNGGIKTQVVKFDVAAATELLGLASPLWVPVTSGGLTTATTAYTAGDVLGTEFTATVARVSGRGAVITSAMLMDASKITGAVDAYVFDRASTPAADNAPNSWADADMAHLLGVISFETPIASALNSAARAVQGLPIALRANSSTDVKVVLVTRVGHTFFGAVGDLTLAFGVEPS